MSLGGFLVEGGSHPVLCLACLSFVSGAPSTHVFSCQMMINVPCLHVSAHTCSHVYTCLAFGE